MPQTKFVLRKSGRHAVTIQARIVVYDYEFEKWRRILETQKRESEQDTTTTDAEVLESIRSKMADAKDFLIDHNDAGEYTGE